ncbi:uncharacterized protein LOC108601926 [Drosophila busckii]|uniref:uncharacterized protein LOC108601926 n=1 Tax=Drosophila busckii TaxID=30019 RepID=UPI00083F4C2D|nr:uncharacterized protein LOC108601926 [Drosophila busckii]
MKLQFALCFVILAASMANAYDGDGQPGCKTQEELDIGVFRDNWDPSSYWKCETMDEPATKVRCPTESGFMDSLKDCVNWEEWQWEKPVAPPSEVDA